jgi:hypothetical protein
MRRRFAVLLIFGVLAISEAAFSTSDSDGIRAFGKTMTTAEPDNEQTVEMIQTGLLGHALKPRIAVELIERTGVSDVIFSQALGKQGSLTFVSADNAADFIPPNYNVAMTFVEDGEFQDIGRYFGVTNRKIAVFSDCENCATTATPEPSNLLLIGTGLVGLVPVLRRKLRMLV